MECLLGECRGGRCCTLGKPALLSSPGREEEDDKRQVVEQVDCSMEIKGYKNELCAVSYLTSDCYDELLTYCDFIPAHNKGLV